jgi:hypothetical protein
MRRPTFHCMTRTIRMKQKSGMEIQETTKRFIGHLRRLVRLLDNNIDFEEERTGISDPANLAYSVTARQLRARRGNLAATILELEKRAGATCH